MARLKPGFVDWLRGLIDSGQVGLLGTAAYHPLLPTLDTPWARAHVLEDIRIRGALGLRSMHVFWPTELAWSTRVGWLAAAAGYEAVVIDGHCRDRSDTVPAWHNAESGLRRTDSAIDRVNRPSRLRLSLTDGQSIELWVRERELSDELVRLIRGEEEDERRQLQAFLEALQQVCARALNPEGPLLLAEDAERLLPDGLARLLDLLDGLQEAEVHLCSAADFAASSSPTAVDYVPAGTMEGALDLWDGTLDDYWFREHSERIAGRLAALLDPLDPKDETERRWRDRMLSLQDSGFFFWPFVSRSRRPFTDTLQAIEAWIENRRGTTNEQR